MAKVMILEDESTGRIYKKYLETALPAHEYVWCRTASEAKKTINDSYAVVILDQRLESTETGAEIVELGTAFMSWCKDKYPHIIGIMLSTHVTREALAEAYDKQWISKYLEKDKKGLSDLPSEVAISIDKSECLRVMAHTNSTPQMIGSFRTWNTWFSPMKVYKISDCIVNAEFLDDNTWETALTIHAGQKKIEKRKLQTSHVVTVKCDSNISAKATASKVNEIVTKSVSIDANIANTVAAENNNTYIQEFEETFEMPPISSDPNVVSFSSMKIQVNRIYEVRTIGLKISCPVCHSDKYVSCEVRIPTNRDKYRKIYVYSDGSSKTLDV